METAALDRPFLSDLAPVPVPRKVRFLSFIIPTTHDDESTLQALYDGVREQAEQVALDWEILFVDYGDEPTTHNVIEGLSENDPSHVLPFHIECKGRSGALALGYRKARGVFVFTLESDQDNDLNEITPFIAKIQETEPSVEEEAGNNWNKILPRGVLRRVAKSRLCTSTTRLTMLPV